MQPIKFRTIILIFCLLVVSTTVVIFAFRNMPPKLHLPGQAIAIPPVPTYKGVLSDKKLIATKVFPKFIDTRPTIYPDPIDSKIIWVGGMGGLIKYNITDKKVENIYQGNDGIKGSNSMVRKGDYMFIGTQEGFEKYNLLTKEYKVYSTKDGLVNGANVTFASDPADADVLWIGTFNGVSKFQISSEKFTNFTKEIGGVSTSWAIGQIKVNKNYVWATVQSNVNSEGGIARYDMQKNTWRTWDPTELGSYGGVYIGGLEVGDDGVFTLTNTHSYTYNPLTDKWDIVIEHKSYLYQWMAHVANRLYFIESFQSDKTDVKYLDLADKTIHPTKFSEYSKILSDTSNKRIILQKEIYSEPGYKFTLYYPETNKSEYFDLKLTDTFKISNLLLAEGDNIWLQSGASLFHYNIKTNDLKLVKGVALDTSGYTRTLVKKLDNKIVVVQPPWCDEGCFTGKLFVINGLNTEKAITLGTRKFSQFDVFVGKHLDEVFFYYHNYGPEYKVYQFDSVSGDLNVSKLTIEELQSNPSLKMVYPQEAKAPIMATNSEGTLSIQMTSKETAGNTLAVKIRKGEGEWVDRSFDVIKPPYSPFPDWPFAIYVQDIVFEPGNSPKAWIATDRGLIRYDFETDTTDLFGADNGLGNDMTDSLFIDGTKMVVDQPSGVYMFNLP